MHRIARILALLSVISCADEKGPVIVAETSQPIVHASACSGTPPTDYGTADVYQFPNYTGACLRIKGDVNLSTTGGPQGYILTSPWPIRSIRVSTANTLVAACKGLANGPNWSPCNGEVNTRRASSSGPVFQLPNIAWPPSGAGSGAVVVGFVAIQQEPVCPYVNGNFARPANYISCGTWSASGLPNIVAWGTGDSQLNPIVADIHTGLPCTCPADAVLPVTSQCVYRCD
jgi:hypothetical protein